MIRGDLKYKEHELIGQYFDDEEELINYLHSKYGDTVMVYEEYEPNDYGDMNADEPYGAIWYERYDDPGSPGDPGTYWDPPDPGEPPQSQIVYEINFSGLIQHLIEEYELDIDEIEAFFKSYVMTPKERMNYKEKAHKRNQKFRDKGEDPPSRPSRRNNPIYSKKYLEL